MCPREGRNLHHIADIGVGNITLYGRGRWVTDEQVALISSLYKYNTLRDISLRIKTMPLKGLPCLKVSIKSYP